MAPSKGNKHAVKLKTPELKHEAYKQYCAWIASGRAKESFCFEHPELTLTHKTMEKYIREEPHVFPAINKEAAESKSYNVWEQKGMDMLDGKYEKCQPAIYQMFMRNKFGWDKENHVTHSFEPEARTLLKKWEES